ncbi:hypothetical protein [Chryseobacterium lacus]|uniref:hypothetical protein n=1 Tax=Chryseobacterium lacus TaxID=2058346 RepID=UPI000F88D476|nr:hypothetical protein [Chryseobacterium lacus]RST29227.1 hypothetical protein EIZ46_00725 [Chryseobacterium lacus]
MEKLLYNRKLRVIFSVLMYFFISLAFFAFMIIIDDNEVYDKKNIPSDLLTSFVVGLSFFAYDVVNLVKKKFFKKENP